MDEGRFRLRTLFLAAYIVFALLPILWMVNMSFRTNEEILSRSRSFRSTSRWPATGPFSRMRPGIRATSTA